MPTIHPTAVIDPSAEIGEGCDIGPYCVIEAGVKIGARNRIGPHSYLRGSTEIGDDNVLGSHCSFGAPPQDLGYKGEPTRLVVGDHNLFGDYVQLCRGSTKTEEQTTTLGDHNYLMAYCHVGHDCLIGNRVVAANGLQLGGHVTVEDGAVIGGLVAVHQYVRIGRQVMIAGGSALIMDAPPFCRAGGWGGSVYGLNVVGLERGGMPRDEIKRLREAYKALFRAAHPLEESLRRLETEFTDCEPARHWVRFFRESKRGVLRERENK